MSTFSISMIPGNNKIGWADNIEFRKSESGSGARKSHNVNINGVQQFLADLRDPLDICASLRLLMLQCFLFGISPFKLVGIPGNRHLVTTYIGVANTLMHLVLFCTSYVVRVLNQSSLVAHFFHSKIGRFGENIQIVTSFMAIGFTLCLCFLKRNKLRSLLHLLIQIDEELVHLGAIVNYKKLSRIAMLALVFQWLLYIVFIGATFVLVRTLEDQLDFFEWMFFFLPYAIISTLKVQFYCMIQLIRYRLRFINLILNNLQAKQLSWSAFQGTMDGIPINNFAGIECDEMKFDSISNRKRGTYDIIIKLSRVHEDLCDACYLAEQYFNHQMLTTVTIEFIVTLFNLYFMFEVAYNNSQIAEVDAIEFIAYFTFYTTITMGSVYALLRAIESVMSENKMCAIYVHKLLNVLKRDENDTKELLMRFSMQLLHRKITFSAGGLFPLDNTLIFTIVGASTTYLIILFQFRTSLK